MFRAPDWLNVFLHYWAHLCGFSPLWVSICIFRFPASLIELLHCVHLYSFTTYYVKLETLPDSLKNLGASYWVISEKRSVWESHERLRNVYYQKNNAAHLQNRDALRSQPCTFVIGPGSGCHGGSKSGTHWLMQPRTAFKTFRYCSIRYTFYTLKVQFAVRLWNKHARCPCTAVRLSCMMD